MNHPISPRPTYLIGTSIPRSGHHFLERLLKSTLKNRLHYCETYKDADCCHSVPCSVEGFDVLYQKSHDFEMTLPILNGYSDRPVYYIIQYREPIPSVLSDRELFCNAHPEFAGDKKNYMIFLADKLIYSKRFYEKWILSNKDNFFKLNYSFLSEKPAEAVSKLLSFIKIEHDFKEILSAVIEVVDKGDSNQLHIPRSILDSKYYDDILIPQYESLFFSEVPNLSFVRNFPDAQHIDSDLYKIYKIRRQTINH